MTPSDTQNRAHHSTHSGAFPHTCTVQQLCARYRIQTAQIIVANSIDPAYRSCLSTLPINPAYRFNLSISSHPSSILCTQKTQDSRLNPPAISSDPDDRMLSLIYAVSVYTRVPYKVKPNSSLVYAVSDYTRVPYKASLNIPPLYKLSPVHASPV